MCFKMCTDVTCLRLCGRPLRVEDQRQQPFQPWLWNSHKSCNLDSCTFGSQTDQLVQQSSSIQHIDSLQWIVFSLHNWTVTQTVTCHNTLCWQNHVPLLTVLSTRQLICFSLFLTPFCSLINNLYCNNPFSSPYKVLTSHSCSEEGLEDAANILLQLSRGDGSTRDTVLRLLLSGARHLGYTLCKQIGQCWATTHIPVLMFLC